VFLPVLCHTGTGPLSGACENAQQAPYLLDLTSSSGNSIAVFVRHDTLRYEQRPRVWDSSQGSFILCLPEYDCIAHPELRISS
jgi:hypothetical protein